MADKAMEYNCTNDRCPEEGAVVSLSIEAGDGIFCTECNWMLSAVYDV